MTAQRPRFDRTMRVLGRLAQRRLKLPPAATRYVTVERDLPIPTDDGVTLLADHWAPGPDATAFRDAPTVLVRTPYGSGGPVGWFYGRVLAERGMHVLLVRSRGTFGSGGGEFLAMRHERADGLAALSWLAEQPWAGDGVILAGSSYLGYTQWAVAADAPVQVKAMIPHITSSRLALALLRPGLPDIDSIIYFSWSTATQERPGALLREVLGLDRRYAESAKRTLPLGNADKALLGREWPFYQECLHHDQNDPYWKSEDHSATVDDVTVPVSSVTGWYDVFLADQLRDFKTLTTAGRSLRLTVGPWWHQQPPGMAAAITETATWGAALARGTEPEPRAPVRLFVMGIDQWRDFQSWPPAGYEPQRWHLHVGESLSQTPPADTSSQPTTFTYDPIDPTPTVGGPRLLSTNVGAVDNRRLERRQDVLTFTSHPLDADLEVIGEVAAEVWIRADRLACHLFVRLCDVDKRGRSINVCDDIAIVRPQGPTKVTVELSPTAHVFRRGHRIRVQISGGSFPRYPRNMGTDDPVPTATTTHKTRIEVLHDDEHPSAILLPAR